jgi:hypothetical protein
MSKRIPAAKPQPTQSHTRRNLPRKETPSARGGLAPGKGAGDGGRSAGAMRHGSKKGGRVSPPAPALLFEIGHDRGMEMFHDADGIHVASDGVVKVTLQGGDSFYISTEKMKERKGGAPGKGAGDGVRSAAAPRH